ncbi:Hypothetical protein, putative [Bodo saltans]|uniref:Uncharacterized protein n=1 Tax=Bodo saltans TaxID=75058 RepID=A0A0S4JBH7_BODSA|nr:Hypothetical protein, putative [Bodo saltans]|eukprot:CUG88872.1 Hypothetical protein, putative [Bodo saltans]
MLRRFCATTVMPLGSLGAFRFKGWTADTAEIDRERQLRQKIQEQYKNIKLPEMTSFSYGNFAGNAQGSSSSSQGSGTSSNQSTNPPGVDWIMMLSGIALCLVGSRLLAERLSGPTNDANLIVPLWCVPYQHQAKYLLYLVATDKFAREQLEREFKDVRVSYPTLNFLDWLESRYPSYCVGKFTNRQVAVDAVAHLLSTGGQMQLAGLGRLLRSTIDSAGDPQVRLDTFVAETDKISGGAPRAWAPPPYAPQQQWTPPPPQPYSGGGGFGAQTVTMDDVLGTVQGQRSKPL